MFHDVNTKTLRKQQSQHLAVVFSILKAFSSLNKKFKQKARKLKKDAFLFLNIYLIKKIVKK